MAVVRGEVLVCVFFFQAEDGIRDKLVTGVQTCALPIYRAMGRDAARPGAKNRPATPGVPRCRPPRLRADGTAEVAGAWRRLCAGEDPAAAARGGAASASSFKWVSWSAA